MGRPTRRKPGPDDDDDSPIIIIEGVPNPTIELQTSDLKELAQDGLVQPRTMHLDMKDLEEVSPGAVPIDRGASEKVIIDLSEDPPPIAKPRVSARRSAAQPTVEPAPVDDDEALPVGRRWIVVLVYVAAAAALGISIYFRFFR